MFLLIGDIDMDPLKTIGKKLKGGEPRDCIHIAVLQVEVGEDYLGPGDKVNFIYGSKAIVKRADPVYGLKHIGIIDPFLGGDGKYRGLKKGDKVWMFLNPGSITGLRHDWSHPEIDAEVKVVNEHEDWLRKFADRWNFNYDEMIAEAKGKQGCIVARGKDLHGSSDLDSGDETLFWYHLEKLTKKEFDEKHREEFCWSCSC
jgi:hypothetical protein